MRDPEYEAPACLFCGGLDDLHAISCPTLVWCDDDDVPPFGTPPEIPDEAPRDPVPTDAELDDCFRALMSHDVLPEG